MAGKELLLTVVDKGVDSIPDSFFNKIPGFRDPKHTRERKRFDRLREKDRNSRELREYIRRYSEDFPPPRSRERAQSLAEGYSDSDPRNRPVPRRGSESFVPSTPSPLGTAAPVVSFAEDYSPNAARQDAARERKEHQNSDLTDTALNTHTNQFSEHRYEPPRDDSVEVLQGSPVMAYNDYSPRPYNPNDYIPQQSQHQDQGYQRGQGYSPVPYSRDEYPSSRRSQSAYSRSNRQSRYDDREDNYYEAAPRDKSRRGRHERDDRQENRTRSKSRMDKMKEKFDVSERGLEAGALGAAVGGLAGHELGHNILGTIAGVVVGGLAGNVWEARDQKKKDDKHRRDKDHRSHSNDDYYRRGRGRDSSRDYPPEIDSRTRRDLEYYDDRDRARSHGGYQQSRGGGYDDRGSSGRYDDRRSSRYNDDSDEDDESYEERRRRRKEQKRREREEQEARQRREAALQWKNSI